MDRFIDIELSEETIDVYYIRTAIKRAIEASLGDFNGTFVDLGCGNMPYRDFILDHSDVEQYIGIDIEHPNYHQYRLPDKLWDGETLPLANSSIDVVMATEVFEHVPDIQVVLTEIYRVLKPNGLLFFTVPFLWPLHDAPFDEYRYTPYALQRHLNLGGFVNIDIKPSGGWNASMAQMLGLWINRASKSIIERKERQKKYFPLYKELIDLDVPDNSFGKSSMITGLIGKAYKMNPIVNHGTVVAIYVCKWGVLTETFIKRHIEKLAPGKTVIITGSNRESYGNLSLPIHEIKCLNGFNTLEYEKEHEIVAFFHEYAVTHLLIEYGNVASQIIELNSRLFRLPIFVHFHGYDASRLLRDQRIVEYYKWLDKNVSKIIVGSNDMKKRLVKVGMRKEQITVNYYGIDFPEQHSHMIESDICKFIFIGRLVEKKSPLSTLNAFAKAVAINEKMTLDIIGGDNDSGLMNTVKAFIADNRLEDKVVLHGNQSHEYVKSSLLNASCYVQHSVTAKDSGDMEGLPNIILEAASYGLPVVSTKHAGIPEAVEDGVSGFLVEEYDVDAMAEKMLMLSLNKALRVQMGKKGREIIHQKFTAEKSINGLRTIMFNTPQCDTLFTYYPLPQDPERISQEAFFYLCKKVDLSKTIVLYGYGDLGEKLFQKYEEKTVAIVDQNKVGMKCGKLSIGNLEELVLNEEVTIVNTVLNKNHIVEINQRLEKQFSAVNIVSTIDL